MDVTREGAVVAAAAAAAVARAAVSSSVSSAAATTTSTTLAAISTVMDMNMGNTSSDWISNKTAVQVLKVLHFAYPMILLAFFITTFTIQSIVSSRVDSKAKEQVQEEHTGPGGKPLPKKTGPHTNKNKDVLDFSRPRKLLFEWLALGAALTFVGNAITVIVHALYSRSEQWWCGQATVVYIVAAFMVYTLVLISILDSTPSPTWAHVSSWVLSAVMEIILLGASIALYSQKHREPTVGDSNGGELERAMTEWEITEISLDLVRIVLLLALVAFYVLFVGLQARKQRKEDASASETTGLLSGHSAENGHANGDANGSANGNGNGNANGSSNGYGATQPNKPNKPADAPAGWEKPTTTPSRSWWEYIAGYSMFFPYLWPSKNRRLQMVVVICFIIMIIQRVIQVLVPIQAGRITQELSGDQGPVTGMPWQSICLYILYRLLQGNNGLLGATRSIIWVPVSQYSFRELSVASFEHVHSLSLDFHLGKKTGEVLSALGKGNAINNFLESVTFQVLPMLVDLLVAIVYFLYAFDVYYALVVAIVTFWYIYLTIRMAQWRAEIRRQMVNSDREVDAVKNDSMISYETVKYFNAEAYEFNRYREAVDKYQKAEYSVYISLNFMNVTQNLVFMIGLMIACFIAAYQVSTGQLQVGKFVLLLTYMAQLQGPLNFFGTFYRMIQSAMINSERMLELFKEEPTVVDAPGVINLDECQGDLRFNDVHFSYDTRKPAVHGLDFHCKPGTTTALVGESGGGKSTVFRLLFRFYNAESGTIQMDGHEVTDVSIDSLRRHIGVVPQDTVLFNETLMYNLKYANQAASDEQIFAACKAASIHDKILSFPDGYNTKVGERGLRLSGGEKQRVAIARTIIKDPRIILLDEATAALDTETEEHIQEALMTLARGRTMLVIAHRLSTITMADQILVLHEGKVAERGSHQELLDLKGRYASMWRKQVRAQRAAEEAKVLKDKADRLRRQSTSGEQVHPDDNSAGSSEDERDAVRKVQGMQALVDSQQAAPTTFAGGQNAVDETRPPGHP